MLYLARFQDLPDCIVGAADPESALRVLAESVEETPIRLQEMPEAVFCAEVRWANDADDDEPANLASAGVVLEPFDALASYLETQANAEKVAAHLLSVEPSRG